MFRSKMIRDPNAKFTPNGLGLTVGLTFHTPKFSDCRGVLTHTNQFYEMRYPEPVSEKELEYNFSGRMHARRCKRHKHLSYPGYLYWTGPKRRYEFRYMGPTHPRWKWWQAVTISDHGRYVRWRDDGPQNPPRKNTPREISDALVQHRARFNEAMTSYRTQCDEYDRMRSPGGKGWS